MIRNEKSQNEKFDNFYLIIVIEMDIENDAFNDYE